MIRRQFIYKVVALMGIGAIGIDTHDNSISEYLSKIGGSEKNNLYCVKRSVTLPVAALRLPSHATSINNEYLPEVAQAWFDRHNALLEQAIRDGHLLKHASSVDEKKGEISWTLVWSNKGAYETFYRQAEVDKVLQAFRNKGFNVSLEIKGVGDYILSSAIDRMSQAST